LKALPCAANFIATADSKAVALWQLLPTETPRNELLAGWTRILAVSPRKVGLHAWACAGGRGQKGQMCVVCFLFCLGGEHNQRGSVV
jgi:hypothetical protein